MASAVKRVLVGKPIATSAEGTQRLTKLLALAVFSSDAVSSTAYATEEILDVLIPEAGLTLGNLRGLRASGRIFAAPTYLYIGALAALIVLGLVRSFTGDLDALPTNQGRVDDFTGGMPLVAITPFLLMRAFSSGAVALTGVEAISNGVPAFRKPEPRNAAITLTWMATILGSGFFLLAVLVHRLNPTPYEPDSPGYQTLLSVLGEYVFGGKNAAYLILQASTALILALAANTAFADFPRLSSIIARDGFLPRQLTVRGDRLVFSNGIIA